MNPYQICDTRHKLLYLQYHETLEDMWYKVLVIYLQYPEPLQDMWYKVQSILFTISWNFTGYVIL